MICLDTSAIIDLFKGDLEILKELNKIDQTHLVSTQLNYSEILFGINPSLSKHQNELMYYKEFFSSLQLLNLSEQATIKASEIHWHLRSKGITIGKFDCLIAGICITYNVTKILTRNVKHFKQIPRIRVITY